MRLRDLRPGSEVKIGGQWLFVLTAEDYNRLLIAAEGDDCLDWCEVCGAWIDVNDPARATTEDFRGCWKAATGKDDDCRSYRACERVRAIREAEKK